MQVQVEETPNLVEKMHCRALHGGDSRMQQYAGDVVKRRRDAERQAPCRVVVVVGFSCTAITAPLDKLRRRRGHSRPRPIHFDNIFVYKRERGAGIMLPSLAQQ